MGSQKACGEHQTNSLQIEAAAVAVVDAKLKNLPQTLVPADAVMAVVAVAGVAMAPGIYKRPQQRIRVDQGKILLKTFAVHTFFCHRLPRPPRKEGQGIDAIFSL